MWLLCKGTVVQISVETKDIWATAKSRADVFTCYSWGI